MSLDLITVHTDRGPCQLPQGSTVETLLQQWQADGEGLATAVNGRFVSRLDRAGHILNDADTVLCFTPITGG